MNTFLCRILFFCVLFWGSSAQAGLKQFVQYCLSSVASVAQVVRPKFKNRRRPLANLTVDNPLPDITVDDFAPEAPDGSLPMGKPGVFRVKSPRLFSKPQAEAIARTLLQSLQFGKSVNVSSLDPIEARRLAEIEIIERKGQGGEHAFIEDVLGSQVSNRVFQYVQRLEEYLNLNRPKGETRKIVLKNFVLRGASPGKGTFVDDFHVHGPKGGFEYTVGLLGPGFVYRRNRKIYDDVGENLGVVFTRSVAHKSPIWPGLRLYILAEFQFVDSNRSKN